MPRTAYEPGDRVLVPNGNYRARPEYEWATVDHIKEGDGSPYPIVAVFDDGVRGQWRRDEIADVRQRQPEAE